MKRKPKPGLPRLFDRPKYRQRNIIERMFGWLKKNRRIVTRLDKLAKSSQYGSVTVLANGQKTYRFYPVSTSTKQPPASLTIDGRKNQL